MGAGMLRVRTWWENEDGAVTVDWVVLTAVIVGLTAIIALPFTEALSWASEKLTQDIRESVQSDE